MSHTVLHADESFVNPMSRDYLVVAITKDEPGYSIVSEWPTLEEAKRQAAAYNDVLGLTEDEILDIRLSSLLKSARAVDADVARIQAQQEADDPALRVKTQKVTLSVTIEVDVAGWDLTYGSGTSAKEIRDHVRSYFVNVIRDGEAGDGSIIDVTEKH